MENFRQLKRFVAAKKPLKDSQGNIITKVLLETYRRRYNTILCIIPGFKTAVALKIENIRLATKSDVRIKQSIINFFDSDL